MQLVKALVSAHEELPLGDNIFIKIRKLPMKKKTHPTLLRPSLKALVLRFIAGLAAPVWLG